MAWRDLAIIGLMKKIFPGGKSHTEHREEEAKHVVVEKIKVVEMVVPESQEAEVVIEKTELVTTIVEELPETSVSVYDKKEETELPSKTPQREEVEKAPQTPKKAEIQKKEEAPVQKVKEAGKKPVSKTKRTESETTKKKAKVSSEPETKKAAVKTTVEKKEESVKAKKSTRKRVEKETSAKTESPKAKAEAVKKVISESKKKTEKTKAVSSQKGKSEKGKVPSKKEQKLKLYHADIKKHLGSVDDAFLEVIVKNLGPSIYRKDAESVACSDPKELETVKNNFLVKKLKMPKEDKEALDKAVAEVCEKLKGVRTKYRATFYYMLAKNLKKESLLS